MGRTRTKTVEADAPALTARTLADLGVEELRVLARRHELHAGLAARALEAPPGASRETLLERVDGLAVRAAGSGGDELADELAVVLGHLAAGHTGPAYRALREALGVAARAMALDDTIGRLRELAATTPVAFETDEERQAFLVGKAAERQDNETKQAAIRWELKRREQEERDAREQEMAMRARRSMA